MASDVFHQLYYHFVWSTKNRVPLISEENRHMVISEVETQCRIRGGILLCCNAMPDHVHLAVSLPPTACVSTIIGKVKGASSHILSKEPIWELPFAWQDGYGVVTFRKGERDKVVKYVQNQQEIHASRKPSPILESMANIDK